MFGTHCLYMIKPSVKFHENILYDFGVISWKQIKSIAWVSGYRGSFKTKVGRDLFSARGTLSRYDKFICEVS